MLRTVTVLRMLNLSRLLGQVDAKGDQHVISTWSSKRIGPSARWCPSGS
jgi:hypothetical protein